MVTESPRQHSPGAHSRLDSVRCEETALTCGAGQVSLESLEAGGDPVAGPGGPLGLLRAQLLHHRQVLYRLDAGADQLGQLPHLNTSVGWAQSDYRTCARWLGVAGRRLQAGRVSARYSMMATDWVSTRPSISSAGTWRTIIHFTQGKLRYGHLSERVDCSELLAVLFPPAPHQVDRHGVPLLPRQPQRDPHPPRAGGPEVGVQHRPAPTASHKIA